MTAQLVTECATNGPLLLEAARYGELPRVMELAALGPHVANYKDDEGWTALHGVRMGVRSRLLRRAHTCSTGVLFRRGGAADDSRAGDQWGAFGRLYCARLLAAH